MKVWNPASWSDTRQRNTPRRWVKQKSFFFSEKGNSSQTGPKTLRTVLPKQEVTRSRQWLHLWSALSIMHKPKSHTTLNLFALKWLKYFVECRWWTHLILYHCPITQWKTESTEWQETLRRHVLKKKYDHFKSAGWNHHCGRGGNYRHICTVHWGNRAELRHYDIC